MADELPERLRYAAADCRAILAKLSTVSDVSAVVLRGDGAEGSEPRDRLRTRSSDPSKPKRSRAITHRDVEVGEGPMVTVPSKLFSLHAHYRARMTRAVEHAQQAVKDRSVGDVDRWTFELRRLAVEAERDYLLAAGHPRFSRNHEHENAQISELLTQLVGVRAHEAATWLGLDSDKWVRQQRRLNGRDPETGDISPGTNPKAERIMELRRERKTEREIAVIVGVSQTRVHQVLAGV